MDKNNKYLINNIYFINIQTASRVTLQSWELETWDLRPHHFITPFCYQIHKAYYLYKACIIFIIIQGLSILFKYVIFKSAVLSDKKHDSVFKAYDKRRVAVHGLTAEHAS